MAVQKKVGKTLQKRPLHSVKMGMPEPEEEAQHFEPKIEEEVPAKEFVPRTIAVSAIGNGWQAIFGDGQKMSITCWLVQQVNEAGETEVVPGVYSGGRVVPVNTIPNFAAVSDPTGQRHPMKTN